MQEFAPFFTEARPLEPSVGGGDTRAFRLFESVLQLVAQEYVDRVDERAMTHGALQSLLAALEDPHSRFLEPSELTRLEAAANGKVEGVGVTLAISARKEGDVEQRFLQIVAPLPNSPAERAGLKPGDQIVEIDGKWIIVQDPFHEVLQLQRRHADRKLIREADQRARERLKKSLTLAEAVQLLTTLGEKEEPKPRELLIKRGSEQVRLKVVPARFQVRPLEYRLLRDRWGYIRLNLLNGEAAKLFGEALKSLRAAQAKGLILDLRNTAGGQLLAARQMLALLVPSTRIGLIQYRQGKTYVKKPLELGLKPTPVHLPIAVLTNRGTYNVAELMALVLRTEVNAPLIGMPTYGDASALTLYKLRDGSGFTLTVGRYIGQDGTFFHGRGLEPGVRVAQEPLQRGLPGADAALDHALRALEQKLAKEARKT